jgi:hypothetical protein
MVVGESRMVVQQRSPNRVLVLETPTGRLLSEFPQPASEEPWLIEPVLLSDDRILVSTDARSLELIDLSSWQTIWRHRDATPLPRIGAPRVVDLGEQLLVVRDQELQCLRASDGHELWTAPLGRSALNQNAQGLVVDGGFVYWVGSCEHEFALHAVRLTDGREVWHKRLASGRTTRWGLLVLDDAILAYPSPRPREESELEDVAVSLYQKEDGRMIQRLGLRSPAAFVSVRPGQSVTEVLTSNGVWGLVGWNTELGVTGDRAVAP